VGESQNLQSTAVDALRALGSHEYTLAPIKHGSRNMNRCRMLILTVIALLGLCVADAAKADETLKFRAIMQATSAQFQDVGDVDGHALGLIRFSGLASMPDGTVGTSDTIVSTDYIKGAGTFMNYNVLKLADGSVLWYKMNASTTVEGSKRLFSGTVSVTGGKGRFEGAKGDGTITGGRLVPLAAGVNIYVDLVINVKK
jgi:hypothetical protein